VPDANVEVVMVSCVDVIVIDRGTDFVWAGLLLSVTVAVKAKVPVTVGVPEIAPLPAARVKPVGRLPLAIDHV
jgi:hypothetical protein